MVGDKPSLLVIDDQPEMGELVCDIARTLGFEAEATDRPGDMPDLYREHVDVVVLDLFMPGVDGVEVLRHLSEIKCRAAIVLMSGGDPDILYSARELALARGLKVAGTISKPIRVDALERLLRALGLGLGRQAAAIGEKGPWIPSEDDLRQALKEHRLVPHFQPKVDMVKGDLTGVEALVRWEHPDYGLLPPAIFVPLAEECGLIDALTMRMLDRSLAQCAEWRSKGLAAPVAVNISARSLTWLGMPEYVCDSLDNYGLMPSMLKLEITETAVSAERATSLDILTRLRMRGVSLAIDDFGTGHSTLQELQRLPFMELKIDQSFVRSARADAKARAIIESTLALARRLSLNVVAEGVEDRTLWDMLLEYGCNQAQGFMISRAMPGADLPAWADEWEARKKRMLA